ncbi:membrane protein [Burkholderia stabilis]|nr:membrane protein [Burkholderia stabilis]
MPKLNCPQGGRMELNIQSHHWQRRTPDWLAAAVAGLAGGALVIVLEFFWSTMVLDESPWQPTHKIAAMVLGRSALDQMSVFSVGIVGTALVLHYVLGAIMGMILAVIIAPFRFDSSVRMEAAIGLAFGIVAYVWNFYVMTAVFPWFVSERGSGPLLANLLFGVVAAVTYGMLERRKQDAMR